MNLKGKNIVELTQKRSQGAVVHFSTWHKDSLKNIAGKAKDTYSMHRQAAEEPRAAPKIEEFDVAVDNLYYQELELENQDVASISSDCSNDLQEESKSQKPSLKNLKKVMKYP